MIFSHLTLKACSSPYMQYYFKQFLVLYSSEVIFSFQIRKSKQKEIEITTAFLYSHGNPKRRTMDHFILQTDTYIDELVEVLLKLSMKTVQVHLIVWTTLVVHRHRPLIILDTDNA